MENRVPKSHESGTPGTTPLRLAPPANPASGPEEGAECLSNDPDVGRSTGRLRVGSVPFLNAVPLTRGLEDRIQFAPPSELAGRLKRGEIDAALISVTEVLFNPDLDVLDGIAVASLGEVKSVFLAHRKPLDQAREVMCDPASLASVSLLRVLLAERGLHPRLLPLPMDCAPDTQDFVLLIGDRAIEFLSNVRDHEIWDLGSAWQELTGLPFVYAVWAFRRDADTAGLRSLLRETKRFGVDSLEAIIANRTEFTRDFRRDYLTWHIHYHLGTDEKRGISKFVELLRKHGAVDVHEPRYVN